MAMHKTSQAWVTPAAGFESVVPNPKTLRPQVGRSSDMQCNLYSRWHSMPRVKLSTFCSPLPAPCFHPAANPARFGCETTRYRSASAASSPPAPCSSQSTFSTSSGLFGSCCKSGSVVHSLPHREWMNSRGMMFLSKSPSRCRISAQPETRSVFAGRRCIPCFPYSFATDVPSLCRLNTSVPATNRFRSLSCRAGKGAACELASPLWEGASRGAGPIENNCFKLGA